MRAAQVAQEPPESESESPKAELPQQPAALPGSGLAVSPSNLELIRPVDISSTVTDSRQQRQGSRIIDDAVAVAGGRPSVSQNS